MNVSSATQTQYTQATNKTDNNKEIFDPLKGQNLELETLDKEGNNLLNQILSGKSDEEKWKIKLNIDLSLSLEVKNGRLTHITDIDNSKSNVMNSLERYTKSQKELGNPDMIGAVSTAEKLLEAYKASNNTNPH